MSNNTGDALYTEYRRPSHVRYRVVLITALMAVLLYLDRFCISFAEVFIKQELNLSDGQIGWLFTAFFLVYALAQVPAGFLTDRFGPRVMLSIYILLWSACTGLVGLAYSFLALLLLRGGIGLFQAGAYPTAANIVSNWVPFSSRGTASSIVAVGGRVGGFLALFLTGLLIVQFVPLSTSSQLSDDALQELPELCHALHFAAPSATSGDPSESNPALVHVSEKFVASLNEDVRGQVALIAQAWREYQQRRSSAPARPEAGEDAVPQEIDAQVQALRPVMLARMNAFIEARHDFDPSRLASLKLEREAKSLLKKVPADLSQAENERLNRLVLEAAFPDSLQKVYSAGWRQVMWTYGLLGLLVAGLFWCVCRNHPAAHPRVNQEELEIIQSGRPANSPKPGVGARGIPMLRLLRSRSMWLVCLSMFFTNIGWVFVVTWAPRYFQEVHRVPVEQRGLMTSIPLLIGWLGMVGGGPLTDLLVRRVGLRWGRALPMSLSRFLAMSAYVYLLFSPNAWGAVAALSLVAFSTDLGTGAVWAFNQDVGGRHVGSILGWSNMWGNFGAAVAPWFFIFIINATKIGDAYNWSAAFVTGAVAFLLSGVICLAVNASIPIAAEEE